MKQRKSTGANRANHLFPIFPTLTRLPLSGGFSLHSPHPSNRTESIFDVASELVHLLGPKTLNKGVLSVAVRRHQVTHRCEKSCFEKALSWMMRLARRSILMMVSRHGHNPTRPCVPKFVSKAYWHARIILWELASDRNLYNFYCNQTC